MRSDAGLECEIEHEEGEEVEGSSRRVDGRAPRARRKTNDDGALPVISDGRGGRRRQWRRFDAPRVAWLGEDDAGVEAEH